MIWKIQKVIGCQKFKIAEGVYARKFDLKGKGGDVFLLFIWVYHEWFKKVNMKLPQNHLMQYMKIDLLDEWEV